MNKYIFLLIVFYLLILSAALIKETKPAKFFSSILPNKEESLKVIHSSYLFDPAFFDQAYSKGERYKKITNDKVFGGIIPHHLLAAPLIAGFFEGIKNQPISTVILLSPNHYGVGQYNITTSKGTWTTAFGNLSPNITIITQLEKNKVAFVDEDIFNNEHGINGITPFIKKTFPNAKIIPIAIKGGPTAKEECDKLIQTLNSIIDDHTLIIASADFSHYLSSNQADRYDQESISVIESFNIEKALTLDRTKNIDSPESIYILLKLMQFKDATTSIFLANTNSAKLKDQPDIQSTTSYLTMYFTNIGNGLSINQIFNHLYDQTNSKNDNQEEYIIVATGDVIPARSVNSKVINFNNFNYPFEKTGNFLRSADAVFINLESPLIPNCKSTLEGMIFCGDQRNIQGLIYAGITVASIANNHVGNYGINGINNTVNLLKRNGIQVTGDGEPAIVEIKSKKFGFLGYNNIGSKEPGIAWADIPTIQQDIQNLKKQVNFVIVAFHWGVEYTTIPSATQKQLAHTAIDAGADLIIGNHPHWIQGIEQYKEKFITYAHGNYVFDQMWSQETREGVLGKYIFNNKGLIKVEFYPIIIENYAQPRFATEIEAISILNKMKESSLQLINF